MKRHADAVVDPLPLDRVEYAMHIWLHGLGQAELEPI
jgi:hypothetical protein